MASVCGAALCPSRRPLDAGVVECVFYGQTRLEEGHRVNDERKTKQQLIAELEAQGRVSELAQKQLLQVKSHFQLKRTDSCESVSPPLRAA